MGRFKPNNRRHLQALALESAIIEKRRLMRVGWYPLPPLPIKTRQFGRTRLKREAQRHNVRLLDVSA